MKTIILLSMLFVSATSHGQYLTQAAAPSELGTGSMLLDPALKDSEIKRRLTNGKIQEFDGNEYMIVKRKAKVARKPAPVCDQPTVATVIETVRTERVVEQLKAPRNSLLLLGGRAPYGLERDYVTVKTKYDAVIGGAYQRRFGDRYLWQLQGLSNESYLGALGIEF